jgi:uncharacterized protein (TIRG00374 family)
MLGLAVSVASVIVLTSVVDLNATMRLLQQANGAPILVALGVVALEVVLRTIRWSRLLPTTDGYRASTARLLPVVLVGYLANLLLPARLGEGVRAYLVSRTEPVAISSALGSVVLERVIDLATLAVVGFVAAVFAGAPAWMTTGLLVVAVLGLVVTGVLTFVGIGRVATSAERRWGGGKPLVVRFVALLVRFSRGAGDQPKRVIAFAVAISVVCWFLDGTTFWLVGVALDAGVSWPICMIIASVTVLGTAIPSAPGYLGTYELAAVAAGVALGVPKETVLAMAVLAHAVTTLPLALGGMIVLIVELLAGGRHLRREIRPVDLSFPREPIS